jgi:hypothetical protein
MTKESEWAGVRAQNFSVEGLVQSWRDQRDSGVLKRSGESIGSENGNAESPGSIVEQRTDRIAE